MRARFTGRDEVFHGLLEGRTGTIEGPAYDLGNDEYVLFRMDGETAAAIVDMKDLTVLDARNTGGVMTVYLATIGTQNSEGVDTEILSVHTTRAGAEAALDEEKGREFADYYEIMEFELEGDLTKVGQ